ncbi:hypothetical protein [Dyella psychrodurans]|uniref:GNAT family N-acetyltransferase n=1 Tax=Dyella psychrodurans TaxID=1927960 RepID=A0A370X745_9GAMM|nr:hypothetical protein [Dyella psychrodurans]RDS84142.1 hypothetical protein DWU99_10315 [Dyella psychrodurans]
MRDSVAGSWTKEFVATVLLSERSTGNVVEAQLFRGLDQKNFDDYERLWRPTLVQAKASFSTWLESGKVNAQDAHWAWTEKGRKANADMSLESFAIECDGKTQGMMLLNLSEFARHKDQRGLDMVYVEMLASAPWNRSQLTPTPIYGGVGQILLGTAISLSIESELKGRLGLHSLPQSVSWYEQKTNFTNLGMDPEKDMIYFEATEEQAKEFLENG